MILTCRSLLYEGGPKLVLPEQRYPNTTVWGVDAHEASLNAPDTHRYKELDHGAPVAGAQKGNGHLLR